MAAVSKNAYMCAKVNEKARKTIFKGFWNLANWDAKKAYLKGLTDFRLTKRRRAGIEDQKLQKRNTYQMPMGLKFGYVAIFCYRP